MKERYTLPVLVFVILAAGIVAVGCLLYRNQRANCRTEAERNLAAVADLKVGDLSLWRKERLGDANVFFENKAFSALVRRCIERPQDLPLQEELRSWISRVQASYGYDRIALLDAAGNKLTMVSDTEEPLSALSRQEAREVLRLGQPTFTDFYPNEYTQKIFLRLFVPIFDGQDDRIPLGVLMLRIDPNAYLYQFIQRWPTPSETAETMLIRREGNEVVFLNNVKFQKNTALILRVSLDDADRPVVKMALGQKGIVEGVDYRGVPVLAAVCAVPDSPWFLVAKIDAAEAYAPMRKWLWLTVLFVGVLLFGAAAAVGLVWRQQHLGLYREKYEAEHKYRNLFESSRDALMTLEPPSWKFTAGNPATAEMFRLKNARELTTLGPWELSPERQPDGRDSGEKAKEMIETAVRDGSHFFEWTHKRIDGEEFPATVLLTRMGQANKMVVQATVRDITEQKRAEEMLRDSEEWYKTLFGEAMDGICLVDTETGLIIDCNQALTALVGRDKAELIGQPQTILHPPAEDNESFSPTFRQHLGEKAGQILDTQVINKTGELKEVAIRARPVNLAGKKVMQGLFRDITDRRRAEDDLHRYAAELEAANKALEEAKHLAECANRAKSEFLANMSHEIRTPMTAVLGFADVLHEEVLCCPVCPANTHCQKRVVSCEAIGAIQRNGRHLLAVINDILDLSKIEAGKVQIEPTRCSPVQVVADIVSLMRVQAAAKQLNLKTELADPLPETVLTDPLRLRQVLVNLLGNAIKFTDQGEVRLAVRLISDRGPPRLRFDVTDTGIGMNEEQVGKLFQAFTQVDSSSTRKFGGTGLGLCISKHLAGALGGDIEVRSAPGKGSTFSVTIDPGPLDGIRMIQNAQEVLLDRPPTTPAATPSKIELHGRVLLAEDGPDNQRLICLLLRKAGADVVAVENGQLAVETVLAAYEVGEPFDVILMDMQMPVMDGYAATRRLREWGYAGPIVALTACAMDQDCQKCLDAGCNDYATKPINRQRLLATVARWVVRGQTHYDAPNFSIGKGETGAKISPLPLGEGQGARASSETPLQPPSP